MMNLGIFGVGHLGKIHIQQWLKIQDVNIMGFYDPDDKNAQEVEKLYNLKRYSAVEDLLNDVELIDIVSPTSTHYQLAKPAIKAGKHLFIEKPFANTIEEGKELIKLIKEAGVKCQVGHVERYNPAFTVLSQYSISPLFIEAHRLAQFDPRGTDVSVILDLMIHDIDIVLSLVNALRLSPPTRVYPLATAAAVVGCCCATAETTAC